MQQQMIRTEQRYIAIPERLQVMRQRVQALYRKAGNSLQHDPVLNTAFEELALALEDLTTVEIEHQRELESWLDEKVALTSEIQRYQELFMRAPLGYLVTSADGTIRMANSAVAKLLGSSERMLIGRSLSLFIPDGQRRPFRTDLKQLTGVEQMRQWQFQIQTNDETLVDVEAYIRPVSSGSSRPGSLWWIFREHNPARTAPHAGVSTPDALRSAYTVLADASVALCVIRDVATTLAQVAQLTVPAIADACVIDITDKQGAGRQLVVTSVQQQEGRESLSRWYPYKHRTETDAGPLHHATLYQGSDVQGLLSSLLNHNAASRARVLLDDLSSQCAIAAPICTETTMFGTFALFASEARSWNEDIMSGLLDELGRRLGSAIQRAG